MKKRKLIKLQKLLKKWISEAEGKGLEIGLKMHNAVVNTLMDKMIEEGK